MTAALFYIAFLVFPLGMAYAAVSDILTMTIPNRLILALLVAFAVAAPLAGMDLTTLGHHAAAGGIVLVVAFGCFAMGWIGGGDAKLAAVSALWLGAGNALAYIAFASVLGGLLTLVLLSFRARVLPAFIIRQPWVQRLHDDRAGVPYGVALAAAGMIVYPGTIWMNLAVA